MTGEIIIRPLEGSLDLPDGAVSLGAYSISGDASLSAFERIMVVYKLKSPQVHICKSSTIIRQTFRYWVSQKV